MRKNLIPRLITKALWGLFFVSTLLFLKVCLGESTTLPLLSIRIRLDSLSTLILVMVTFLGATVGQYSVRYLDGEKNITRFFRRLVFTVLAVAMLVVSSNLIMFFLSWFAMSMGLHGLLLFYPDRPLAVLAARKKFLISRIGDVFLLIAIGLVYKAFGTFEFEQIFRECSGVLDASKTNLVSWSGIFFAAGAMTKSAQFPFHFWLPETMETPTPVSALMHAGIINAGGFLILRLSPIMDHASIANLMLASIGALTAVFASLVMVAQNDIKKKLANSTISQMGFMMFACGIGAYTFALFHIVTHSLYKAHAFLSTGDIIEENKKITQLLKPLGMIKLFTLICIGIGIVFLGLFYKEGIFLAEFTYASVLFLGLYQNTEHLGLRIAIKIAGAVMLFFVFEWVISHYVGNVIVLQRSVLRSDSPLFVVCLLGYFIFAIGFYLGNIMMNPISQFSKSIYFLMWNGGYIGVRSTSILQSFWPNSRGETKC